MKAGGAATLLAAFGAALVKPGRALAAWNKGAFEEKNIADAGVLAAIAARHGIADAAGAIAKGKAVCESNTQEALARQVFGAPTYVYLDQLFWGQDRLDFLDRALAK